MWRLGVQHSDLMPSTCMPDVATFELKAVDHRFAFEGENTEDAFGTRRNGAVTEALEAAA